LTCWLPACYRNCVGEELSALQFAQLVRYFINPLLRFMAFNDFPSSYSFVDISPAAFAIVQAVVTVVTGSMNEIIALFTARASLDETVGH